MQQLGYTTLKSLAITADACRALESPQVRTPYGIKLGVTFSESCIKLLDTSGSYSWIGAYDPDFGLYGQKALQSGHPAVLVASDLEVLKLKSFGLPAICLADPKNLDTLTMDILADNLRVVTSEIHVWPSSGFNKRNASLEKFALHLAASGKFTLKSIPDTEPVLYCSPERLTNIIEKYQLVKELNGWKPQGVQTFDEVINANDFNQPVVGYKTGYKGIDESNSGIRTGEITMFTAGSGVGKSTIVREIAYHLGVNEGVKVGMIFLEEKTERTAKCLAAIRFNKPVDVIRKNPEVLSLKEWKDFKTNPQLRQNFMFHNHFGSLGADDLFSKIEYMIDHFGAKFICLDHISIVVSGMSSKEGERKDIDILMTRLATLAVSKDVGFISISHLSQPEGVPHEEGGRVTLSQLRGSGSIKQLSASIFALERNQQNPDSTLALVRQLKARETGNTGPVAVVNYNPETGRLLEDPNWNPLEFERELSPRKGAPRNGGGGGRSAYGGSGGSGANGMSDAFKGVKFIEPY